MCTWLPDSRSLLNAMHIAWGKCCIKHNFHQNRRGSYMQWICSGYGFHPLPQFCDIFLFCPHFICPQLEGQRDTSQHSWRYFSGMESLNDLHWRGILLGILKRMSSWCHGTHQRQSASAFTTAFVFVKGIPLFFFANPTFQHDVSDSMLPVYVGGVLQV